MSAVRSRGVFRRVSPDWLGLREEADAAARSTELVARVGQYIDGRPSVVIHDLGCGTGSMGRWLAPKLAGQQHWIMYDRDEELLGEASAGTVDTSADGAPVTVEVRRCDITRLTAADIVGGSLVTGSALLDLLTAAQVERVVAACVGAGCPALLTLSVDGRVDLMPADPLDAEIAAAFSAHQRRRWRLGPDAVEVAVDAFARRGAATLVRPSPWRLGSESLDLLAAWLDAWLDAACEQRPALAGPATAYAARRVAQIAEGRLDVVVHHNDLLAL